MLNPCDAAFAETLSARLPEGCLRAVEPRYVTEPRGRHTGIGGVVALPRSVAEVSEIVRACAEGRVGIVPFGGGTGLVGGQVMEAGPLPLILSLERMAAVRSVFPAENVLVVEAGATLAEVQEAALAAGRMFPLALASQGTARIGGNLATNAGGVNVLRYGNIRDLCLGVEAVLPDGSVLNGLKRLRKDNSGYDLRHLLIGSEGTLGVITAAALRMVPRPAGVGTAMLVVESPAAALALLAMAEERLAGCVSAFELISRQGLLFLDEVMPEVRQPFVDRPAWMVLIELGLPRGLDPQEALEELFVAASEAGLVSDGVIAQSAGQQAELWRLRESLPDANRKIGAVSSHDISVPLSEIPGFISAAEAALAGIGSFRINCFGHVGDGNLHFNLFPLPGQTRADHDNQREAIKTCVHDIAHGLGGSVSAEHGVGRLKTGDMERYGDPAKLAVLRSLKAAIDPLGIMNPGALLAEQA
ncbi:FAD-binding protein [Frigidibacter albus]|uniref:FAD-binding protein n=1 Tax=Frigidibacter albus TaxID=1465486 RepID=A0A6L8VG57_9RHOB|nr:FAD-binding oxidoreductase [Frigidibacter albus]MZQ89327.1 FAD-binding protein [Frigidibacter albus]NBE31233.1 FAD-binding protein [Frigidibacter albus]